MAVAAFENEMKGEIQKKNYRLAIYYNYRENGYRPLYAAK